MDKKFPILQTNRLLLRQIVEDDIENIFAGLSHPDITQYYAVHYHSLQATKEQMQFYVDVEKNETGIFWAVCSADNRYFMGVGGLNNIDTKHKKGEIGFWLMTEFWGQGIMTEAMPLICNYAFEYRGLHRIEGFVETHNRNCQKAMSKLRFTLEGTMRDCEIKNGNYISLNIYALLKEDNASRQSIIQTKK